MSDSELYTKFRCIPVEVQNILAESTRCKTGGCDGWLTVFFNRVITTYFFNMLTICTQHLYLHNFVIYIYFMYMFLIKQDRVFGILLYSIFTYNKRIIRVLRQWLNSVKWSNHHFRPYFGGNLPNSNIFNMHNRFSDLFGIE